MREALCARLHEMAVEILPRLLDQVHFSCVFKYVSRSLIDHRQVDSKSCGFWLEGIRHMAQACVHLRIFAENPAPTEDIQKAIVNLYQATTNVKVQRQSIHAVDVVLTSKVQQALEACTYHRVFHSKWISLFTETVQMVNGVAAKLSMHKNLGVKLINFEPSHWTAFTADFGRLNILYSELGEAFVDIDEDSFTIIDSLQLFCALIAELTRRLAAGASGDEDEDESPYAAQIMMYAPRKGEKKPFLLPRMLIDIVESKRDVREFSSQVV